MTPSTEDLCISKLNTLTLPDKERDILLNQHTSLTYEEKTNHLSTITNTVSEWIETIHLALFTMEQNIKQHNTDITNDTHLLDEAVQRMDPIITSLNDIVDVMDDSSDEIISLSTKANITKLQSEWSGLQHFLSSVKQSFLAMDEEKQLRQWMDQVLVQIEDLSTLVFRYQEQRTGVQEKSTISSVLLTSSTSSSTSSPSASSTTSATVTTSDMIDTTTTTTTNEDIIVEIDNRVGPLFDQVDKIYNRMISDSPPTDTTGILVRRHRKIQERWECVRVEIDELRADRKEERWLAVFKQVADQVEAMMDGLDKTVEQCQVMIQQVREWQGFQHVASSSSTTTVTPQQQYPVPPKGILRSSKSHHSSASISSNSSSGSAGSSPPPRPVDHIKLRSVEKNFEAKYKYCTPLITKMLSMLGDGIAARVAENNYTVTRHQLMVRRWQQLKSNMDDLRIRDLPDIERLVMFERPISPAWSKVSDRSDKSGSSSQRYKSPEPALYDMFDYRSSNNSIGSLGGRARSPLSLQQHGNNGYMSPTSQLYGMQEELRRGRSVTPSSGTGSWDHISLWRSTNGSSPVHGKSIGRTTSPLSSFHDIMKPSTSDTPSIDSNSHRSTQQYSTTSPSLWQEDIPSRQSPASVPSRCRSRQEELPYGGRRSVTPVRRSGTPSMIPRPKTPSQDHGASQIPRPRSSMLQSAPSSRVMMTPSPSSF
ncbi:uncharacterized protein BX664DRAFT_119546 [Halteromyces radiatus]|uniref:uncharacterized protein n=1 Tax=Halteromyces radiatus TaxID=101107 RepID=UPI00221E427F|nr:uncharacterized protein BX664DRAFT_119546 [Halteromyces radiatus]KAI8088719.1 hypothetical protein BX664DRAFT_119546 [Halteromyces radiatus]